MLWFTPLLNSCELIVYILLALLDLLLQTDDCLFLLLPMNLHLVLLFLDLVLLLLELVLSLFKAKRLQALVQWQPPQAEKLPEESCFEFASRL